MAEFDPLLASFEMMGAAPFAAEEGEVCYDPASHAGPPGEPVYGTFFTTNHFLPRGHCDLQTPSIAIAAAGQGAAEEEGGHHVPWHRQVVDKGNLMTVETCSQSRAGFNLVKQYIGTGYLALPYAISKAGLWPSAVLIVVQTFLVECGVRILNGSADALRLEGKDRP